MNVSPLKNLDIINSDAGLHLINMQVQWPEVYQMIKSKPALRQWEALGSPDCELGKFYSKLNLEGVKAFLDTQGPLQFMTELYGSRLPLCEKESTFCVDVYFAVAFAHYLATVGKIPTEEVFWVHWQTLNTDAMNANLENRSDGKSTLKIALKHYPEKTEDEVCDMVRRGAEYRVKKAWAGLIRELYTLTSLTDVMGPEQMPGLKKTFPGLSMWLHPILDCSAKCDGIAIAPDHSFTPRPLAIYLNTPDSESNIERKADGPLKGHLYSVEVKPKEYRGLCDTVMVPGDIDLLNVRGALAGIPACVNMVKGHYL